MPSMQRFSIIKLFLAGMISIVVLISCFLWGEWYFERNREFQKEVAKLEETFLSQQKEIIQREVASAIDFIRFQRLQLEEQAKIRLQTRVYEAHKVASHLYQSYRGKKSDAEIFALIKESLRAIRFNNERGYFFATSLNGTAELFPNQPELEGSDLSELVDSQGLKVTQGMIALARNQGEGFFSYTWLKPQLPNQHFPKLSFIKYFAPANWYIGTGEYLDDLQQEAQTTILKRISNIRFGKNGFLFALDYDSRMLAHPESKLIGNLMLDSNFPSIRDVFPKMMARTDQQGGFVEYQFRRPGQTNISRKISYVARVPELEWLIGAGFFLDSLETAVAAERQQLQRLIFSDTKRMVAVSLIAICCSALIVRLVSRRLQHSLALFNSFFAQATSHSTKIEQQDVLFTEFDQLAQAANSMIDERYRNDADRKQLEAQLMQRQKLEAIGTLAGGIAHDFNNLLASITGNLTLLSMKLEKKTEAQKYLRRLNDAVSKATSLVTEILSFSRFSEGQKEIVDLTASVKESLHLLRSSIPKSVEIEIDLPDHICPVLANKTHLHQVLMNLCSNAFQALPDQVGKISLRLSTLELKEQPQLAAQLGLEQGEVAHLAINDSGTGIPQEILAEIFDPFFTTKETGKGTGLGLSIAHRIICNYQGLINVESQLGAGSTFHIYLPLAETTETSSTLKADSEPIKGSGTILLVDDDPDVLESMAELLEQLGYQLESYSAPAEALNYAQQHAGKIKAVITDQTMPGMNGIELIEKIREIRPELPIILCTGFSDQVDEATAQSLELTHFMMKPVSLSQLSRILSELS